MKKNILVILTALVVIGLFSIQLVVSNRLATMGAQLSSMQNETAELKKQNEIIEHKIASASSLMVIASEAEKLGFSTAEVRVLKRPPVALNQ